MSHTKIGWNTYHLIAEEGNLNLLEELVEKRSDLTLLTGDGRTMLHIAALNGNFLFVTRLLEVCPNLVEKTDVNGWTALHCSVAGGDIQIFQVLAEISVSLKKANKHGLTCLHVAAQKGHVHMVKRILDVCPDVLHATTNEGRTAIHEAVNGGHIVVFKELVRKGLHVQTQDENGATCLHLAAERGHCELVDLILKACPDVKNVSNFLNGTTALDAAASHGFVDVFQTLVRHGMSVYSFSEKTGTCLHAASFHGQLNMVKHILKWYSDLLTVTTTIDGWTPLHKAVAGGHMDVFKELMSKGADPRFVTVYGGTNFHIAVAHCQCDMVRYLMTVCLNIVDHPRMDGWTPLHQSAADGHINIFKTLIDGGVSAATTGKNGETCLHIAASRGQNEIVKYIVKYFPNLLLSLKLDGRTALHEASAGGNIETFDELIRSEIKPSVKSNSGETCLNAAAITGRNTMISHILGNYPELLKMSKNNGWTALHDSAANGHLETFQILSRAGLLHSTRTCAGETAQDLAKKYKQEHILDFISQKEGYIPASKFLSFTQWCINISYSL